jgi:hypothetical protein
MVQSSVVRSSRQRITWPPLTKSRFVVSTDSATDDPATAAAPR